MFSLCFQKLWYLEYLNPDLGAFPTHDLFWTFARCIELLLIASYSVRLWTLIAYFHLSHPELPFSLQKCLLSKDFEPISAPWSKVLLTGSMFIPAQNMPSWPKIPMCIWLIYNVSSWSFTLFSQNIISNNYKTFSQYQIVHIWKHQGSLVLFWRYFSSFYTIDQRNL